MPTSSTPQWAAQHAGVLGQADAMAGAASINQFLGTHPATEIYQGTQILTPNGTGGEFSVITLNQYDKAQPFTMSGTSIGRVAIPMVAFGTGADLIVSLCNDNAGTPGTVITRTRIPASWFLELSAYTAIPGTTPTQLAATNAPLATPMTNTFTMGEVANFSFTGATPSGGGFGSTGPAVVNNGSNAIIVMGGLNTPGTYVTNVFSIAYGGTNTLVNMAPQPSLPTGLGSYAASTITTDPSSGTQYVIIAGGQTGNLGSYSTVATVYASQLTGSTGQMSAWSTQASLPQPMQSASGAASGNYVYVVGGVTPSNTLLSTAYWANVQNGQLQSWNTGPALPVALYNACVCCVNGFLIVAGGFTGTGLTNPTTAVWYAPINTDGSLGSWQSGPNLPAANDNPFGASFQAGSDGLIFRGFSNVGLFSLPVSSTAGPGPVWQRQGFTGTASGALLPNGPGQYYWFEGFTGGGSTYRSAGFILCPYLSVPLPATGLTNGATYHIMFQQPSGATDPNNYLGNVVDSNVFPGNPLELYRTRGSGTWTTAPAAIPLTIYDNSNNASAAGSANNQLWHTWGDNGARITALVCAGTPDRRLIGICESTVSLTQLNANSGFEGGTSPWVAVNGTLTQSNAWAYEGAYSALLTPTGGFSTAAILSEKVACVAGVSYTVKAWAYSPGGYSNVDTQINWYDASSGFLSSSVVSFNAPAGTPTDITAVFTAPLNAALAQIALQEAGTPAAGNTVYFDQAMVIETYGGTPNATVTQVTYADTWPGAGLWPPTGVKQLA